MPNDELDMDFINLNQVAHGDRKIKRCEALIRFGIFFCVIQSFRRVIDGGCKPRSDKDEKKRRNLRIPHLFKDLSHCRKGGHSLR